MQYMVGLLDGTAAVAAAADDDVRNYVAKHSAAGERRDARLTHIAHQIGLAIVRACR